MRLLHRTKNLAELAIMMVAVLYIVVKYCPKDVNCDVLEGKERVKTNFLSSFLFSHKFSKFNVKLTLKFIFRF